MSNEPEKILEKLAGTYPSLGPQLQRAARYMLDNPADIAINSMRQVAKQAKVAPATMLRLSQALDYDGYDQLREPFKKSFREQVSGFSDRARMLQARGNIDEDSLRGDLQAAQLDNVERAFSDTGAEELRLVAQRLIRSRLVFVLGMRSSFGLAHYFYYVLRMVLSRVVLLRAEAGLLFDDLADASEQDTVVAISANPYTRDAVDAAEFAKERGVWLVALTDSVVSPLAELANRTLIARTATPQFFPSMVAAAALAESLLAAVVSIGDERIVENIERYTGVRERHSAYWLADSSGE